MLTIQGSVLVCLAVIATAVGVVVPSPLLAMTGLAVLIWVWLEWLWFEIARYRLTQFANALQRTISGSSDERLTLVTDRDYEVDCFAVASLLPIGYRVLLRNMVPDTFSVTGDSTMLIETGAFAWLGGQADKEIHHRFKIQTPICGKYQLPGVLLELTDQRGLFTTELFAPVYQEANVLPFLIRPQTTVSILKHNNLQRHLGHHRHRSSGISSELHGIRDYRVGDPPRSIAWKATARMGKLMTCEYENEVPIRSTILVDLAPYQFDGRPGPTAGDRAISTTASIARLLLADRDPVAVEMLRQNRFRRLDFGSGERQMAKIIQHLLSYSDPNPPLDHFAFDDLTQVVFENATHRFPEMFDERFNRGSTHFRWLRWHRAPWDRMRRALSVVFEYLFQLAPGMANRLQHDNSMFRRYCLKYIEEFNVVSTATTVAIDPPYRDVGQWMRERNNMTLKHCERLTNVRSRAKDNELFIVIAPEPYDLLGCEMVEAALKQFVAAGHRAMFIAPERPIVMGKVDDPTAADVIERHSTGRFRKAHSEMGERLNAIGISFARINHPKLMQLVANEVGILQSSASRSGTTVRGTGIGR